MKQNKFIFTQHLSKEEAEIVIEHLKKINCYAIIDEDEYIIDEEKIK